MTPREHLARLAPLLACRRPIVLGLAAALLASAAALAWALLGESPLRRLVHENAPPVNFEEQAASALALSSSALRSLRGENIALYLRSEDIAGFVEKAIKAETPDLGDVKIAFGPQRIELTGAFARSFSEGRLVISGDLIGTLLVAIADNRIVLTPSFASLRAREVTWSGAKVDILAPAINLAIREFIANVNGQIEPIALDLDFAHTFAFDLAEAVAAAPGVAGASAPRIEGQIELAKAAVLVDEAGIHGLAKAVLSFGPPVVERINGLCAESETPTPDLACASGPQQQICEAERASRGARHHVARELRQDLCPAPEDEWPSDMQGNPGPLAERLAAFRERFFTRRHLLTGESASVGKRSYVIAAKSLIASAINRHLSEPLFPMKVDFTLSPRAFTIDARLEKAPDLKCGEVALSCEAAEACAPEACAVFACAYDCQWWDAACLTRKLGCETNKAAATRACEANQQAKVALCRTAVEARRLECERFNIMKRASCTANQAWLDGVSEAKVGTISGNIGADGRIEALVRSLYVTDDLSRVEVGVSLNGSANLNADIAFAPAGLGNIACVTNWQGRVAATVSVHDGGLSLAGEVGFEEPNALEPARLELRMPPRRVKFQISPPPLEALLAQNPDLMIACGPAVATAELGAMIARWGDALPLGLSGEYEIDLPRLTARMDIAPAVIVVPGKGSSALRMLQLKPVWLPNALGFTLE